MEFLDQSKVKSVRAVIVTASIVIPVVVAALFSVKLGDYKLTFLPAIYATINGLTAVVLLSALSAIKKGNMELHRKLIRFALLLSLLFLVLYVLYHLTSDATIYGDTNHDGKLDILEQAEAGSLRYVYFFFLMTHILLSVVVVPLVLFTYLFAWEGKFDKHKRWTKITFPIWLYVAVTGVIVYFMIAPYYA